MPSKFKVGLTRDFLTPEDKLTYEDIGLSILDAEPGIEYSFFAEHYSPVAASQLRECDAVISLTPPYTTASFQDIEMLKCFGMKAPLDRQSLPERGRRNSSRLIAGSSADPITGFDKK